MTPTALNPEVQAAICGAIEMGLPLTHAAAEAGVDRKTVYRWLAEGEKDLEAGEKLTPCATFAAAYARARSKKVRRLLSKIKRMAAKENQITGLQDPKPLMWILERTEPEFRPNSKVESDVNLSLNADTLADAAAKLEQKLAEAEAALGGPK